MTIKSNGFLAVFNTLTILAFVISAQVANSQMVINNSDAGTGSLRQVIQDAAEGAVVQFMPGLGTIKLESTIVTSKRLRIIGLGTTLTIIDGSLMTNNPQLFSMTTADVIEFENISFVNSGNDTSTQWGGALNFNNANDQLKLSNCVFDNNEAFLILQ